MDVSALGSSSPSFLTTASSPSLQLLQAQQSVDGSLFGGVSGAASDLESLTSSAAAYTFSENSSLLTEMQRWDGSETPGSQRTPATDPYAAAAPITPNYAFNPFDSSTWGAPVAGNNLDVSA